MLDMGLLHSLFKAWLRQNSELRLNLIPSHPVSFRLTLSKQVETVSSEARSNEV